MINKLIAKIQKTKAPIVVGLDPMLSYIRSISRKRLLRSMERRWREPPRLSGSSIKRLWTRPMT